MQRRERPPLSRRRLVVRWSGYRQTRRSDAPGLREHRHARDRRERSSLQRERTEEERKRSQQLREFRRIARTTEIRAASDGDSEQAKFLYLSLARRRQHGRQHPQGRKHGLRSFRESWHPRTREPYPVQQELQCKLVAVRGKEPPFVKRPLHWQRQRDKTVLGVNRSVLCHADRVGIAAVAGTMTSAMPPFAFPDAPSTGKPQPRHSRLGHQTKGPSACAGDPYLHLARLILPRLLRVPLRFRGSPCSSGWRTTVRCQSGQRRRDP